MGFYQDQLLPRLQDKVMGREPNSEIRARVCGGLTGEVVEVGFGTGLNVRHYPPEVTRVFAVEPSSVCMRIADTRIAKAKVPVEQSGRRSGKKDLTRAGWRRMVPKQQVAAR
jgi:hypothetical protein